MSTILNNSPQTNGTSSLAFACRMVLAGAVIGSATIVAAQSSPNRVQSAVYESPFAFESGVTQTSFLEDVMKTVPDRTDRRRSNPSRNEPGRNKAPSDPRKDPVLYAESESPEPIDLSGLVLRLCITCAFIIGLCLLTVRYGRKWLFRSASVKTGNQDLTLISTLGLGNSCSVQFVKADGRDVLIGSDRSGLKTVTVLPPSFSLAAEADEVGANSNEQTEFADEATLVADEPEYNDMIVPFPDSAESDSVAVAEATESEFERATYNAEWTGMKAG